MTRTTDTDTIITAIKPTGAPHLGNYVGAIAPTLALCAGTDQDVVAFVADGHALNSMRTGPQLRSYSMEIVASYIACGLDPERVILFRQSDVPEIFELAAILACVCPKGTANRAHAYKAKVAANLERDADPDTGVNMGLFSYPIVMAADILALGGTRVPVGPDQLQHVEITRELARRLNADYGDVVAMPHASVTVRGDLPGSDGRKMSKSYDNTISLFADPETTRRQVSKIRTSSRAVGEPGEPGENLVLAILETIADPPAFHHARDRLLQGAGDGELKQRLVETVHRRFGDARLRHRELLQRPDLLERALRAGTERARDIASTVLTRVKKETGLGGYVGLG